MKTLQMCGRAIMGLGLVVLGAYLVLTAFVVPQATIPAAILTYSSAMLVAALVWDIVFFVPRMSTLASAKQSRCNHVFSRAFDEFKAYCVQRTKNHCYISRFLMYIFTVLVIAALVVKGSIAIAVLLSVAFIAEGSIGAVKRKVASGKVGADSIMRAAV